MQGSEDRLVDPSSSRLFYEKAASQDKTLKFYVFPLPNGKDGGLGD